MSFDQVIEIVAGMLLPALIMALGVMGLMYVVAIIMHYWINR